MKGRQQRTIRRSIFLAALALVGVLYACSQPCPEVAEKTYHHLVILGDPHLPGQHLAHKKSVRKTINSWKDVDLVIAVGDICAEYGTEAEYATARAFFAKLDKPLAAVAGNHDVILKPLPGRGAAATWALQAPPGKPSSNFFARPSVLPSTFTAGWSVVTC